MCRFVLYLGPTLTLDAMLTRPVHSLVRQSYCAQERSEPLNGDGFGVAWYVPELAAEPGRYRSIGPAWSDQNLRQLGRVTQTQCLLAHVRAASPGLPVVQTNCHPFVSGRFAWMHNGHLSGFHRLRRRLLGELSDAAFESILGSTDSEHLFAIFLDAQRAAPGEGLESLATAMRETLARARDLSRADEPNTLNLAVADGTRAVVARAASGGARPESLYWHEGQRYGVDAEGRCRMEDPEGGHGAVIVSSEPLSQDPGWDPVPPDHLVLIEAGRPVELRPLGESWAAG